jgi:hypothetical protein
MPACMNSVSVRRHPTARQIGNAVAAACSHHRRANTRMQIRTGTLTPRRRCV